MWTACFENENYSISNLGNIFSHKRKKLLRPFNNGSGYLAVVLAGTARRRTLLVHRLVLLSFEGLPPETRQDCRHVLSPDKADNRLCNLAWGTRSENMKDVWRHRVDGHGSRLSSARVATPNATYSLDERLVRLGLEFHTEGKLNIHDLCRLWDCTEDVARPILYGETWTHLDKPKVEKKQLRRTVQRKKEILDLVTQGLNAAQINEKLDENLTAQDVYYYKKQAPGAIVSTRNEKMSDALVKEILVKAKETGWGAPRLAKHFGKSTATLSNILAGTSYTHVPRDS